MHVLSPDYATRQAMVFDGSRDFHFPLNAEDLLRTLGPWDVLLVFPV